MMELDELKIAWTALDNRLKKNETLEARIICEMKRNNANKSLNKLANLDLFGLIITALAVPFMIWSLTVNKFPSLNYILIFWIAYAVVSLIWQGKQLLLLMKIDFSKSIGNNIEYIQRYNVLIKRSKIITIFAFLMAVISYLIIGISTHADVARWTLLVSILVVVFILSYWLYKKIYEANIASIKNSLEELKELEEE